MLRLLEPTSGQVLFDGRDIFKLGSREMRLLRRQMQIIFQDPYGSLNPRQTVAAMLEEPVLVHGASFADSPGDGTPRPGKRQTARERAGELLSLVGLPEEALRRYPHEFSGGQRQRIGIARSLALSPRFIVCDEAVSALDLSVQAQVLNLLAELQERLGLTYLFIAHDLSVVRHVSNRIAVMYLGEIVEEADTDELFARPLHPYTQALLASVPIPVPRAGRERARLGGDVPAPSDPPPGCRFHTRCPIAIDECKLAIPPMIEPHPGHKVACIRAENESADRNVAGR
jgi:oligopeptide/dipeptide ABC transporter ATP-binding protein